MRFSLGLLVLVVLIILTGLAWPETVKSTLNGLPLEVGPERQPYSFWAIGHSYGSYESPAVWPSASLLANISKLNSSGAACVFFLGDLVKYPTRQRMENFMKVTDLFSLPLFNATGNHELIFREQYIEFFGPTWRAFRMGGDEFICLDTVLANGAIEGEQLTFLKERLEKAAADPSVKTIWVMSHFLLWITDDPRLQKMHKHFVPQLEKYKVGAWSRDIEPLLKAATAKKPVYWFSGDNGRWWNASPLYWKVPEYNATFISTALRDCEVDECIHVTVDAAGKPTLEAVSLTGAQMQPLEQYTPEYWELYYRYEDQYGKPKPISVLKSTLKSKVFWQGVAIGAVMLLFLIGLRKVFCLRKKVQSG